MTYYSILLAIVVSCAMASDRGIAADLILVSPGAMSSSLTELVPRFEQSSGHKVTVRYSPALALAERVRKGEAADVAILGSTAADGLAQGGTVGAGPTGCLESGGAGWCVR